jgi:hypothetical protein
MRQQITRLSPIQTAKVMAALYGLMGFIFLPLFFFAMRLGPEETRPAGLVLLMAPLAYAAFGFIFVAIGCLLYNFVASFTGGIEVDLEPSGRDVRQPIV